MMDSYSFSPRDITVPVDSTVSWTDEGEMLLTIVDRDEAHSFKSSDLDANGRFSHAAKGVVQ